MADSVVSCYASVAAGPAPNKAHSRHTNRYQSSGMVSNQTMRPLSRSSCSAESEHHIADSVVQPLRIRSGWARTKPGGGMLGIRRNARRQRRRAEDRRPRDPEPEQGAAILQLDG